MVKIHHHSTSDGVATRQMRTLTQRRLHPLKDSSFDRYPLSQASIIVMLNAKGQVQKSISNFHVSTTDAVMRIMPPASVARYDPGVFSECESQRLVEIFRNYTIVSFKKMLTSIVS